MAKLGRLKRKLGITLAMSLIVFEAATFNYTPVYAAQSGTVNCDVLNVRSGSSTSNSVVTTITKGTTVEITNTVDGWYEINLNGTKAYVSSQYISTGGATAAASGSTGSVNVSVLNLRSGPSTDNSVVASLYQGQSVTITETSGEWYKVTVNSGGTTGYVYAQYITVGSSQSSSSESAMTGTSGEGVCNTSALNVRSGAGTSYDTYGCITKGTKVTLLETNGSWYKIQTTMNGQTISGYVSASFITVSTSSTSTNEGGTASSEAVGKVGTCNVSALYVRKEASTSAGTYGMIGTGTQVNILEAAGSWYKVQVTVNGSQVTGYVYCTYITVTNTTATTSSESSQATEQAVDERVWATAGVNVRSGAGTTYATIGGVAANQSITRTAVLSNGWSRVTYNGTSAYISSEYLTTTNPNTSTSGGSGIVNVTGQNIVDFALQYVGYPYVWGGNDLNTGVDCSGFTQQVYKHFGISINRVADAQRSNGVSVDVADAQPGDLFFYGSSGSYADHVAIYIGDGKVVHASSSSVGIIISNSTYRTPIAVVRVIY